MGRMLDKVSKLRPVEEIVCAHNFLVMLLVDKKMREEVLGSEESEPYREVRIALSVLCWALNHDNDEFVFNLDRLSKLVKMALAEEALKEGAAEAPAE
jgi:hypothetical protein